MLTLNRWKKVQALGVSLAVAIGSLASANASSLNPGATISLRSENEPVGGQLVAQTNFAFSTPRFTGTLTSKVWLHDAANPWGGLTFAYRLASDIHSESVGCFTLDGFGDLATDASYSGRNIAPCSAARSDSGDRISFNFLNQDSQETLLPGTSSAGLIVHTGGPTWDHNCHAQLDSWDMNLSTFTPAVVPEPAVTGLFGLGAPVTWFAARRKH
jgi:hypothetical protein